LGFSFSDILETKGYDAMVRDPIYKSKPEAQEKESETLEGRKKEVGGVVRTAQTINKKAKQTDMWRWLIGIAVATIVSILIWWFSPQEVTDLAADIWQSLTEIWQSISESFSFQNIETKDPSSVQERTEVHSQ
jgi:hypothetical protein